LRSRSRERGQKGVTLIELVVVMAIVAIMALFMAPAIGEWVDNFRIRQAARDISSTLQQAKMQAISTRQPHSVTFTPGADIYQITPVTAGGGGAQLPKGVTIVSGSTISFSADGTSPLNGTITINNTKGKQYQVSVSATGRIQMQEI